MLTLNLHLFWDDVQTHYFSYLLFPFLLCGEGGVIYVIQYQLWLICSSIKVLMLASNSSVLYLHYLEKLYTIFFLNFDSLHDFFAFYQIILPCVILYCIYFFIHLTFYFSCIWNFALIFTNVPNYLKKK